MKKYHLAIDIGASSGRFILTSVENGRFVMEETHRFPNGVIEQDGKTLWDYGALFNHIMEGLKKLGEEKKIPDTIGIDTWGVDYVLLDEEGNAIAPTYAYRDVRGDKAAAKLHKKIPFKEIYMETGIQYEPFNTIYQLYDDLEQGRLDKASDWLQVPAYLSYLLTGKKCHEYTEVSTGALLDPKTKKWNKGLLEKVGLPLRLFEDEPIEPPFLLGNLKPEIQDEIGFDSEVVMIASHDTGSAINALPSQKPALFLSSGTWSLLGVELPEALVNEETYKANFTNEGGVGEIRFLKNIMGLWLIQKLQKEFPMKSFADIAKEASEFEGGEDYELDIDDEKYLNPKSVKDVIAKECKAKGYKVPESEGEFAYAIYLSLAKDYKKAIAGLENITKSKYDELLIVGGGSKNKFLNRLIEKETGLKITLGSSEGTALGNAALQALYSGAVKNKVEMKEAIIQTEE
ncbi:MAG: rhamnulokinase [Bacilli bacterium]|nr:rhamnulokinase [Bacilli bacterium]